MLGNFTCFFVICWFFQNSTFSKKYFRNTIRVSNSLDPDQDRHSIGPDLGPNCLQRLIISIWQKLPLSIRRELRKPNCGFLGNISYMSQHMKYWHLSHPWADISATRDSQQCGMCNQQRLRPACACPKSDQSLCWLLEYSPYPPSGSAHEVLTEQHLEFLSSKEGCTGLSKFIYFQMTHCWKSHATAMQCLHCLQAQSRDMDEGSDHVSNL